MEGHLGCLEVVKSSDKEKRGKQHKLEDRKQDIDTKVEKGKGKIRDKNVGKNEKQEGSGDVIEGQKKDKSKREGRDEGKEKRKVREEERRKEDKKRKERAMDEERESGVVVQDKALEDFDGKAEEDGKKEKQEGEGENGYKKDRTLNKDKRHTKEKDRYNVEKLKKKLAKLDAKLEKIMAKRKDYFLRLKEVESSSATEFEITDCEPRDQNLEILANDLASMNVSGLESEPFPEVVIPDTHSELSENQSARIVYPKIEQNDITGIGY